MHLSYHNYMLDKYLPVFLNIGDTNAPDQISNARRHS